MIIYINEEADKVFSDIKVGHYFISYIKDLYLKVDDTKAVSLKSGQLCNMGKLCYVIPVSVVDIKYKL